MIVVYLTGAWLVGIFLGSLLGRVFTLSTLLPFLWVALSLPMFIAYLWRQEPRIRTSALCSLLLLLGVIRCVYALHRPSSDHVAFYNDGDWVRLRGVVCREPDIRDRYVNLVLSVSTLEKDEEQSDMQGKVLLQTGLYPRYSYGDELEVSGILETPPEFEYFSYKEYLAHQGVHSLMRRPSIGVVGHDAASPLMAFLYDSKARFYTVIARVLPEPEASLLAGVLLGMDRGLPEKVSEVFKATGLLHIVVISGFNISIVAGWIGRAARRIFGAKSATWIALGGIVLYTLLVGADPPVVRAAIMGGLALMAYHTGRAGAARAALAVAVFGMTLLDPHQLWSVSFQLSGMATLGLVVIVPRLEGSFEFLLRRWLGAERALRLTGILSDALLVTLAAQIMTLPLLIYYFHRVSLISIVTNILVLPVQPLIMVLGGVALLLGVVWLPLGQASGWAAWLFLTYTIRVAEALATVPFASLPLGRLDGLWIGLYYILLGTLLVWWKPKPREGRVVRSASGDLSVTMKRLLVSLSLVVILVWIGVFALPDGRLHVYFLDVGQGDAILIRTPDGKNVLLDGGPSPAALMSELGRRLPFWDRTMDLLILSHPENDHITGLLPVLERYAVEQVMESGWREETPAYAEWEALIERRHIARTFPRAGTQVDLGQGVFLEILHPGETWIKGSGSDTNNNSLVIRLTMGQVSFLLTADIEVAAERLLLSVGEDLECTILKVPHHGAGTSLSEDFLKATDPQIGVISVGRDNDFGHPTEETITRLLDAGVLIFRTDEIGSVEVVTDGRSYTMKVTQKQRN